MHLTKGRSLILSDHYSSVSVLETSGEDWVLLGRVCSCWWISSQYHKIIDAGIRKGLREYVVWFHT